MPLPQKPQVLKKRAQSRQAERFVEPEVADVQGFHGEEQTSSVKTSRRGHGAVRLVQAQQETAQAGPDEGRAYCQVQTAT